MLDAAATAQRHAEVLARLAELAMAMAEQVAVDAATAETPAARAECAKTFHTLSRSIRQSLALEARVVRDALRVEADAEARVMAAAEKAAEGVRARRRTEAKRTFDRLVWTEWDLGAAENFEFRYRVGRAIEKADFLDDEPLERQILRLIEDLGVELPDPETDHPSPSGEGQAREASQGGETPTGPGASDDPPDDTPGLCAAIYPGGPRPIRGLDGVLRFNGRLAPPMELLFPPDDSEGEEDDST